MTHTATAPCELALSTDCDRRQPELSLGRRQLELSSGLERLIRATECVLPRLQNESIYLQSPKRSDKTGWNAKQATKEEGE